MFNVIKIYGFHLDPDTREWELRVMLKTIKLANIASIKINRLGIFVIYL